MAAPTIPDIMRGIEARLATISGLRTKDVVPDQINPPQAIVGCPNIPRYHATMAMGAFEIQPTVTILVSATIDRVGQIALAEYANPTGPKSVVAAIEADKTLGGIVTQCFVASFQPFGVDEVGVIGYYGGTFTLRCMAQGS